MRGVGSVLGVVLCVAVVGCSGAPEPSSSAGLGPPSQSAPSASPTAVVGASATISAGETSSPGPTITLGPASAPPTAAPATTVSVSPAPSPTSAPPLATAGPDGWIGPSRIARRFFDDLALAVDGDGAAHVAAASNAGVVYFTNESGSWTRQRITTAPDGGYDGRPQIAADRDGSIFIAFARYAEWFCFGIGCVPQDFVGNFLLIAGPDGWSSPAAIPHLGDMAVRDGVVHFAYEGRTDAASSVVYATGSGSDWSVEEVGPGSDPSLELASDGTARIAFLGADSPTTTYTLHYATAGSPTGSFSVQPGPTPSDFGWPPFAFALDDADRPHFVAGATYVTAGDGGWTEPQTVFEPFRFEYGAGEFEDIPVYGGAMGVDGNGAVHVVSSNDFSSGAGVWYATNRTGSFTARHLWAADGFTEDGPSGTSELAVDALGRPHVAFNVLSDVEGVWHAAGPAD